MDTAQHLDLQPVEPGEDYLADEFFYAIRDVLQQDSEAPLEVAIKPITELLPEGRPYSYEVADFAAACFDIAMQIPYNHPLMAKLIDIIDCCHNTPEFMKPDDTSFRYQKFGETMRHIWDGSRPAEDPQTCAKYVNFQYFCALVDERNFFGDAKLAIYTLRDTFKDNKGATEEERNAYVKACSLWLIHAGDLVYQEIFKRMIQWSEWEHWHQQLCAVAAGEANTDNCVYDEETRELARKAIKAMEAIKPYQTSEGWKVSKGVIQEETGEGGEKTTGGARKTDSNAEKNTVDGEEVTGVGKETAAIVEGEETGAAGEMADGGLLSRMWSKVRPWLLWENA